MLTACHKPALKCFIRLNFFSPHNHSISRYSTTVILILQIKYAESIFGEQNVVIVEIIGFSALKSYFINRVSEKVHLENHLYQRRTLKFVKYRN